MRKTTVWLSFVFGAFIFMSSAHADQAYTGVGLTVRQDQQVFTVVDKVANGPADVAGVQVGDQIVKIDGYALMNLNLAQVTGMLRGPAGTSVVLSLWTPGNKDLHEVTVVRDVVEVPCYIEGWVNLRYSGLTPTMGSIDGFIGQEHVDWNVNGFQVTGTYKGDPVNLNIQQQFNNLILSGWAHGVYLSWSGYQGAWNFYQTCIQ